jgi:hypothetical protein
MKEQGIIDGTYGLKVETTDIPWKEKLSPTIVVMKQE